MLFNHTQKVAIQSQAAEKVVGYINKWQTHLRPATWKELPREEKIQVSVYFKFGRVDLDG